MAFDARSRSSIYRSLVPVLGEHDANLLMSEFPSVEADELAEALHRQTVWLGGAIAGATALLAAIGALH